jgi:hypothetical protein
VAAKTKSKARSGIKARPTLYRGILMRSRLEADFAAFLDQTGAEWEYEPTCFAGPAGQWLPDFRVKRDDYNVYFEIKPDSTDRDRLDEVLERMSLAWLSEPSATLQLTLWSYRNPVKSFSIAGFPPESADDKSLTWWILSNDDSEPYPWSGMGQLERLLAEQLDRMEAGGGADPSAR